MDAVEVRRGPTALDIGNALLDAERACRRAGAVGLTLSRLIDGWTAGATLIRGRRFRETVRTGPGPLDVVCEELVDRLEAHGA